VSLACTSGCHQRDRHLSACPCADSQHEHGPYELGIKAQEALAEGRMHPGWADCPHCTGCLPRLAAPGLAVCPGM
jgi:hypothetical protein